jgi:hypothetical protein
MGGGNEMTAGYAEFIRTKTQFGSPAGFAPVWMPDFLFDFQKALVEWAVVKGRAAIYADCGLGKSPMELVWAENIVRHTNKPVLLLTHLAVAGQMVREAEKFGVNAVRCSDGKIPNGARVVVTNYDRLHLLSPDTFAGVACDESSAIKNLDGKRTAEVTEFLRTIPYRLLCTATAAPNDYDELGTSSEALGELGHRDMVTKFFKKETTKDHLGWGRTKYQLKGHAQHEFWRWVCSWARAVRKPSDLGFDDGKFVLPPLSTEEHCVKAVTPRSGVLFDMPAITLEEQREERRRTMSERCDKVASLVDTKDPAVVWCHLNPEGDRLEKIIPGAVQVSGSDSDESKEERFVAFAAGQIRVLVSKPVVAGFGLNWQHCAHQTFFPSHSFEQYYQAVRRCWRFGQTRPVKVDVVTSEGESGVLANLKRKAEAADEMFAKLVSLMNDHLRIERKNQFTKKEKVPSWLSSNKS